MKDWLLVFGMTVIALYPGACRHNGKINNSLGPVAPKPIQLFNGSNFEGWYKFIKSRGRDADPKNVFTIHDGMIHISGEEYGCITTNKEFDNYALVVEYKWGTKTNPPRELKARDNGVLIHSRGQDGGYDGTWMHSIECQIIEGGTGDFLVVGDGSDNFSLTSNVTKKAGGPGNFYTPGGKPLTIHRGRINWYGRDPAWKDTVGFRSPEMVENPTGEWNTMKCLAIGDSIAIILNGVVVNECYQVRPSRGRIQIQSEGAEMFVRKVELTPLPEK